MRLRISDFRFQIAGAVRWLLPIAMLLSTAAYGDVLDRVLAVVSGQIITLSDVTAARDLGLESAAGAQDPVRAVLNRLIDRELILDEAERYAPPEPQPEAIDREFDAVRQRFASTAALEATLARCGIDDHHLRETIRQNLRIRAYLEQRFSGSDERRQALIDEWVAGLRRRADVVDLYIVK